jgi:hypothetical protein
MRQKIEKRLDWTLLVCIAAVAVVIFPLGHALRFGTSWSYSAPLNLLAIGLEGIISGLLGWAIQWTFIGRHKAK